MKKLFLASLIVIATSCSSNSDKSLYSETKAIEANEVSANTKGFLCHGTEPFWSLEISSQQIDGQIKYTTKYKDPNAATSEPQITFLGTSPNHNSVKFFDIATIGTTTIIPTQCSNGMSDQIFDYEIIMGNFFYGCCELK